MYLNMSWDALINHDWESKGFIVQRLIYELRLSKDTVTYSFDKYSNTTFTGACRGYPDIEDKYSTFFYMRHRSFAALNFLLEEGFNATVLYNQKPPAPFPIEWDAAKELIKDCKFVSRANAILAANGYDFKVYKCFIDKQFYPTKAFINVVYDDKKKRVFKGNLDSSSLNVYGSVYYSRDTPGYFIEDGWVPLSVIINNYDYCEEHRVAYRGKCPECADRYKIMEYNTKAEDILPSFVKEDNEKYPTFLGVELEYDNSLDKKKSVKDFLKNHVILKRDGSVRDGFEIVTCPATLAIHKKAFKGFFDSVPITATTSCGMHVHIDKTVFNEMALGKFIAFINNKDNYGKVEHIAGRSYYRNSYCAAGERKVTDRFYGRTSFFDKVARMPSEKYEAVRTNKGPTIELRIFAPPINEQQLFSRLEFVQALVDFTKPCVVSVKDAVKWEKFEEFVIENRKFYPNLMEVI